MTRTDVTLRGEDAEWFEDRRKQAAQRRDGHAPNRSEYLRMLLEDADV